MSTTGQAVTCSCGGRFQAPAPLAGRRVSCPACGRPIDVPALTDSSLDAAALAMQSLPAADPLRRPAAAASPAVVRRPVPLGLWIGLGAGGGAIVLVLVVALALWNAGQRLIAENMAKEKERQAAGLGAEPSATKTDGPQVYQSPTGRFSVEFPGKPRRELVRGPERGGLSHWEVEFTRGEFRQGRGEQYLVTDRIRTANLKDEQIEAAITNLVNITAGVDIGRGRILTTTEITAPGQRGREVTYESQTTQGGRFSGRYRVLITDREIISLEWIAAPASAEPAEVTRFFDSFKQEAN